MYKVAYQPFTVLVRAEPSDSPWISTSAKVLRASATFATAIALFGAIAICTNGFGAFTPRSFGSKALAGLLISPATKATTPADRENTIDRLPPDTNQVRQRAITSDQSTFDQTPGHALASISPSASMTQPDAPVRASFNREHSDAARKIRETPLPNAAHKSLENARHQTVRKRAAAKRRRS
jgi:hypothetical protein